MAESAVAGALRIDLSMGTAQFEQGTKKAEARLDRLAKKMGVTAGAAAAAGTLIGTYLVQGLMYARNQVEAAIKSVDDLNDAAQRVGVGVESFSALAYAAKLSGGSIETLEVAFRGLSNKMDEAAQRASGPAAAAFAALGVKVSSADGKLRDADKVLLDLADSFSKMPDGPKKTAMAIDIFSKSGGTMIQMLNEGKDGIGKFMAEAKALGLTVDKETAAAMAKWADDSDKLNLQLDGLWKTIAMNVIPMVKDMTTEARRAAVGLHIVAMETGGFVDWLTKLRPGNGVKAWFEYEQAMKAVREENVKLVTDLEAGIAAADAAAKRPSYLVKNQDGAPVSNAGKTMENTAAKMEQLGVEQLWTAELLKQNDAGEYNNSIKAIELQQFLALNEARYLTMEQFAQLNQLQTEGEEGARRYQEALFGVAATMDSEIDRAADNVVSNLTRIQAMFENLSDASASQWLSMGDVMVDTLSTVFGQSKEFAIAETVINTAQAIMKTMASLPFPASLAAAAAVGAMGAAQVAKIASTNKGGGGGGGASAAAAVPAGGGAAAAAAQMGPTQTLFVQNINPNQLYSGEAVRSLAEALIQFQRDGGKVVLGGGP